MKEAKVKWLGWSKEAFKKAQELDKPILLGISAVWCHWCHVMDQTTYSDSEVTRLIEKNFVPIRVDRDRRPDIDKRYNMGGWPSTVFLTPDGDVLTGGTDNHMVLINVANLRMGMTGHIAQQCLEDCGIIVNKNRLPYDPKNISITSGIRIGTPIVTRNGMGDAEMSKISSFIDAILRSVRIMSDKEYEMNQTLKNKIADQVRHLCSKFPLR